MSVEKKCYIFGAIWMLMFILTLAFKARIFFYIVNILGIIGILSIFIYTVYTLVNKYPVGDQQKTKVVEKSNNHESN